MCVYARPCFECHDMLRLMTAGLRFILGHASVSVFLPRVLPTGTWIQKKTSVAHSVNTLHWLSLTLINLFFFSRHSETMHEYRHGLRFGRGFLIWHKVHSCLPFHIMPSTVNPCSTIKNTTTDLFIDFWSLLEVKHSLTKKLLTLP